MQNHQIYNFNAYALPVLFTGTLMFLFGFFVYQKNRISKVNKTFFYLCVSASIWILASGLGYLCRDQKIAEFWFKIKNLGVVFVPAAVYHFVVSFLEKNNEKRRFVIIGYIISSILGILITNTGLLVTGVKKFFWGYFPRYGMLGIPVLFFFFIFMYASFLMLLRSIREAKSMVKRNQTKYLVFAFSIAYTGLVDFLPAYGINIYPFGYVSSFIFLSVITYAMITARLMDINVAFRNTLIYTTLYTIAVGVFVLLVVFIGQLLFYGPRSIDSKIVWMGVFALFVVVLAVKPLDKLLTKITDKYLFQKRYEYQHTLRAAAKGMASVTDIDKLFKLIVYFLTMRIRVTHADLFYFDDKLGKFIIKASRGKDKLPFGAKVSKSNSLIEWLEEKKEVLITNELENWLKHEQLFPQKTVLRKSLEEIHAEIIKLRAALCIPCFIKDKLIGFLVLGEKLSGELYSQEDVDVLSTLSHETAVAIENAKLYKELYSKIGQIEKMYEKEKKLFVSTAIAFANAIDAKDAYTHGHTERVTKYCLAIGQQIRKMQVFRLEDNFEETLHLSGLLHDVGKIGTPDNILNKKGPLTRTEYEEIKKHPIIGASILYPIKELGQVALAIKHHQERYDGKGYPDGIKGEEIPLAARIIMVADTFDAMITDRPYRCKVMDEEAIKEIENGAGGQFDPLVVDAFLQAYKKGEIVRLRDNPKEASVADVFLSGRLRDSNTNTKLPIN